MGQTPPLTGNELGHELAIAASWLSVLRRIILT